MQTLHISLDPGFDSMKVVANGEVFKFPFNVVETDERKMTNVRLRENFMLYQAPDGSTYRVGQYAREMAYEDKTDNGDYYTEQRFISPEFQVGIDTAIALAIVKTGLYDYMDRLEIYLMVALPHACRAKYASTIIGTAAGQHVFSLQCGENLPKKFRYSINEKHIFTLSQTIAAILGETSDDNGNLNEERFFLLSNGPTLVLDGGYYTMGMVVVSRGGSVEESRTESDTKHAMANVNARIAEEVHSKRPDITHASIEYLLGQDNGVIRYMEDGKVVKINLIQLRKQMINEVCDDLIAYLDQKYEMLLDLQYVLVTGGTGACYYPHLLEHYTSTDQMDKEHLILSVGTLGGKKFSIEYAIAIGAYKGLKGVLQA